jgi:hypothetical protein
LRKKDLVGPALYWSLDGDEVAACAARRRLREEVSRRQHGVETEAHAAASGKVRMRAIRSFDDFPNIPVTAGEIFDADSEVVRRVPEGFERVEA